LSHSHRASSFLTVYVRATMYTYQCKIWYGTVHYSRTP